MKPNKVKIQYDSVFNNDGVLKLVSAGNIAELNLTKQMQTMLNTNIENIRRKSSDKFDDIKFDVRKGFDKDLFKEMINEWRLTISDKYGIYNLAAIKIVEEGAECDICKSLNGNAKGRKNCKTLYRIDNEITKETLWVGTICINKFDISVYHEGKRVKSKDVSLILDRINDNMPNYVNDPSSKVWDLAYRNGSILLRDYRRIHKDKLDKETYYNLSKNLEIFQREMVKLNSAMYTCYNDRHIPDFKKGEAYQEAIMIHQNLYNVCRDLCNEGYYVFAPSVDFSMNYISTYAAFFIFTVSHCMSRYYNNMINNIFGFKNINIDIIRNIRDQTRLTQGINGIKGEINSYMSDNEISMSHIMAILIMLGDREDDLATLVKIIPKNNLTKIYDTLKDMEGIIPRFLKNDYKFMCKLIDDKFESKKKPIQKLNRRKKGNRSMYN